MNLSPIRLKWFAAPVMAIGLGAVSAPAQAPELAMLNKIQPGLWNLKERGTAQNGDQLCVRDARKLLQLRHRELQCSRFVVSDEPDEVTVTYRCPGGGSGRTTIKYEAAAWCRSNRRESRRTPPSHLRSRGVTREAAPADR